MTKKAKAEAVEGKAKRTRSEVEAVTRDLRKAVAMRDKQRAVVAALKVRLEKAENLVAIGEEDVVALRSRFEELVK